MPTIPGSRRRVGTIVNGPDARTVAFVGALDVLRGLATSGRLSRPLIGLTGSPAVSYRGDLGPQQQFRGWAGVRTNLRGNPALALPLTATPDPSAGKR